MDVYVNGKKIRIDPKRAIGKGGEADVFDIGQGKVLKLFKQPHHPDYQGLPQEQQAARDRLQIQQQKLPRFPRNLPNRVIAPEELAKDKASQIIYGYTMPFLNGTEILLRYGERSFRQAGISQQQVVQIFQDLHNTVSKLHFAGVVIGDFNDLNVLVKDTEAYLIDTDSFQFGAFPCTMFTARFVDPLLCDRQATQPILQLPHNSDSDWYAFAVMLMQCLLFVDPYGGVYKPKDISQQIPQGARSLHRITIFHPEVRYPKPAIPYKVLPDELLHYFHQVFEQDRRGEFPRSLLDNLHWSICQSCGLEHGRSVCPECQHLEDTGTRRREDTEKSCQNKVTTTLLFKAEGIILFAAVEQGQLKWVYHQQGQFHREDGSVILNGELNPNLRWRIQGKTTLLGYQGQIIQFHPHEPPERIATESFGATTLFDCNESTYYWIANGQLLRNNLHNPQPTTHTPSFIGDVLPNQTRFWVGSHFGFGFYQAGDLKVAFVFDAKKPGINDRVQLPHWQGQLIQMGCTFSDRYGWLFVTTQERGQIHYRCIVLQADGTVCATAKATEKDENWLTRLGKNQPGDPSPYCAVNDFLLACTDDGIIRVEIQQKQLVHTTTFVDTEAFVDSSCRLLPANTGLYVVNHHNIQLLELR
jgi:serine/threonine protein kinase